MPFCHVWNHHSKWTFFEPWDIWGARTAVDISKLLQPVQSIFKICGCKIHMLHTNHSCTNVHHAEKIYGPLIPLLKVWLPTKHADTFIVGDNCWIVHHCDRLINIFSYEPSDGHTCAQMNDMAVGYDNLLIGQLYTLLLSQEIHVKGLMNDFVYPMQSIWRCVRK